MTNIWPHMLRALPPTIGRHNRAYDADDADAADDADDDDDDDDDAGADDIRIASISMIIAQLVASLTDQHEEPVPPTK